MRKENPIGKPGNALLLPRLDHALSVLVARLLRARDPLCDRLLNLHKTFKVSIYANRAHNTKKGGKRRHMLLLPVQRLLLPNELLPLLPLVHLERPRIPLKVPQRVLAQDDRFLDRVVQELLVVRNEDEGPRRVSGEKLLEPDDRF